MKHQSFDLTHLADSDSSGFAHERLSGHEVPRLRKKEGELANLIRDLKVVGA